MPVRHFSARDLDRWDRLRRDDPQEAERQLNELSNTRGTELALLLAGREFRARHHQQNAA